MNDELKNRIAFYIACVGAFAQKFSLSNAFAYNYLDRYKGMEFLYEHYDVEHTFSIDDTVSDLQKICRNNGGMLK